MYAYIYICIYILHGSACTLMIYYFQKGTCYLMNQNSRWTRVLKGQPVTTQTALIYWPSDYWAFTIIAVAFVSL